MCVFILPAFHVSFPSNFFLVSLFEFFESGSCNISRLSSNSEFLCLYLLSTKVTKQGLPCLLDPTFFPLLNSYPESSGNHNHTLFYVIVCCFLRPPPCYQAFNGNSPH